MQLPYHDIPATTPWNRWRVLASSREPNLSEFSRAMGRAPIASMSRTIPPTPVAAPCSGSTADGWLWDSTLNTAASPSPRSTAPAFSSPDRDKTRDDRLGSKPSRGRECLYPQCSLHNAPNIPNSTGLGSRSRRSRIISYSALVRAISSKVSCAMVIRRETPLQAARQTLPFSTRKYSADEP